MNIATILHDGERVRAIQTGSRVKVEAAHNNRVTVTATRTDTIRVSTPGPQGPVGPVADLDLVLSFVDGAVTDYKVLHPDSFEYAQGPAVYHVDIVHPLDHLPTVTAVDSAGDLWRGAVSYPALNRVTIDFNVPFSGRFTLT